MHAATGEPKRFEPLSVASAGPAWRNADGTLGLCVLMNVASGPWTQGTPPPEGFELQLASADLRAERSVTYAEWRSRATHYEGGGRSPGSCEFFPEDACLLTLELVDGEPDHQQLRVRNRDVVVATVDLRAVEPEAGNPLYWPLVPLAYAGDAVGAVVSVALHVATLVVLAPVVLVGLASYPMNAEEMERERAETEARIAAAEAQREAELARDRSCPEEPSPPGDR